MSRWNSGAALGSAVAVIASTFISLYYYSTSKKHTKLYSFVHSNAPLFLVIDIGSSSIRCSAFVIPDDGPPIFIPESIQRSLGSSIQDSGEKQSLHNANQILERVNTVVDQCLAFLRQHQLHQHIIAIGFTSFVMNFFGVNNQGHPVTRILTYADQHPETSKYVERLTRALQDEQKLQEIIQATGTPMHTGYAPGQILRLQIEEKKQFKEIHMWQTISSYIIANWTGQKYVPISCSEASWTGLLNFRTMEWHDPLIQQIHCPASTLPAIRESSDYETHLCPIYGSKWPELNKCRLHYGLSDGAAANIGSKCITSSRIACTVGTSGAMRVLLKLKDLDSNFHLPFGLWCYRITKEYVLIGGAVTDGGSIFEWMCKTFNSNDPQLFQKVEQLQPNGHSLTVLPYLNGERSPGWNIHARASIVGMNSATKPEHFIRAGLESVAFNLAEIYDLLKSLILQSQPQNNMTSSVHCYIIASGSALENSPLWRQILADTCNEQILLERQQTESTSKGVVVLITQDFATSTASEFFQLNASNYVRSIPRPVSHLQYQNARQRQKELYHTLHD